MKIPFLKFSGIVAFIMMFSLGIISCKDSGEKNSDQEVVSENETTETKDPFFKISLAQWSLSGPMRDGSMDPVDFAQEASKMGFEGIEYVSQLYTNRYADAEDPQAALQALLDTLKAKSEEYNVENVLIMVDHEGELASADEATRTQAVENHKKWVDAAEFLGAKAIRVNLFGAEDEQQWKTAATDGLTKLSEYASGKNIDVLVENHGNFSSNAALLTEVIQEVNMANAGTLPDFGNFCLKREGGEQWETKCVEEYPKYQGVEEMMPYAKAVSAKTYEFNDEGEETTIDFERMLKIVKDAGYTGYIGIEYEGSGLSPEEGILATKELLIEKGTNLNSEE
ncbi:sugar phosphate isomerase/epimerase family protein [Salegentibacter sp. F188]|uniref:Sugar phosphate isomerase/epimerase family protein n=1 Tax=Autumnicola patrickiae TaxID=3075591 RepID=A0ABU3E8P9_9FLAO|nr:sugar phosphate isomerase/epimerase family protein [Salegentibacter sp. F188]MDT0691617.1 sugar phosphate isomerase/epimerase family protein [Salegentibacter sp. F188]